MNDPIFRASEFPFIETDDPIECSPLDCMCGIYDNTYDNYFYSHHLNLFADGRHRLETAITQIRSHLMGLASTSSDVAEEQAEIQGAIN